MIVPDCSPCGLSVDWLRSCYASRWHLFADSLGTQSAGRYYFSPADTPFVGVFHHYGSRQWYESNWGQLQGLGEDLDAKQAWYRGDQPAVIPNAEIVGSGNCIQEGGTFANRLTTDGLRNGFPIACYTPHVDLDPLWEISSTYNSCGLQFFYATIITWMYLGDSASIQTAFSMLLGTGVVTTHSLGTLTLPGVVTVVTPRFTIVVIDGTINFEQFALQAFYAIDGPQNFGIYGSNAQWYAASTRAKDIMLADGANLTGPVFVCGHSYGAATACNLAARLLAWQPDRVVRRLNFAAPRLGDDRLKTLLETSLGLSLVNDTDPVPSLPPNIEELTAVATFLGLPQLFVWTQWLAEPGRSRMDVNGALTPNADPILDFPTLLDYAQKALASQPIGVIFAHAITEYRERILKRCPTPEWPISLALWNFLQGLTFPEYWGNDYWGNDYFGEDYWF